MNSETRNLVIAIDGPSGAGKSTVAGFVSKQLFCPLLDTGAMYRCVALAAMKSEITEATESSIQGLLDEIQIRFSGEDGRTVLLNGEDVSAEIRTMQVSQQASRLSTLSNVRAHLVKQQQAIIAVGSWVLEGRDVTTVVAPSADLKIFLTASIEERARRRWVEATGRGEKLRLQEVVKEVVERDHRDYTRDDSPLQLAEDATIIESFGVTAEQVAQKIMAMLPR